MDDEPKRKDSLLRTVLKPILTVELLVGVTLAGIWLLIYDTPDFRGALLTCAGLYVLRRETLRARAARGASGPG